MVRIHRGSKKRPESKDSGLFFILATMDSNRKVRRPRGGKAARDGGDRTLRRPGSDAHDARSWKANPSWLKKRPESKDSGLFFYSCHDGFEPKGSPTEGRKSRQGWRRQNLEAAWKRRARCAELEGESIVAQFFNKNRNPQGLRFFYFKACSTTARIDSLSACRYALPRLQ